MNYYKLLKINKDASNKEIKDAYGKLSRTHHPDRNKSTNATKKLSEINAAYETLSKPNSRKLYDLILKKGDVNLFRSGKYDFNDTDLEKIEEMFDMMNKSKKLLAKIHKMADSWPAENLKANASRGCEIIEGSFYELYNELVDFYYESALMTDIMVRSLSIKTEELFDKCKRIDERYL